MAAVINVAINDTIILRDNGNVALTGMTSGDFSVLEAYEIATPATTAAVTLTEIGGGEYAISFTPTSAAIWTAHVVYDTGGVFREFSATYDVLASTGSTPLSVGTAVTYAVADLRVLVARRLRDYISLTLSADGSETTATDELRLIDSEGAYTSTWGYCRSGTAANVGRFWHVSDFDDETSTLTFRPALPDPTATGDRVDLHNLMGRGFHPTIIDEMIYAVVDELFPEFLIPMSSVISAAFDRDTPIIAAPVGMMYVAMVMYDRDGDGIYWEVPPDAWEANIFEQVVEISRERFRDQCDGTTIKLQGYGRHGQLTDPSDSCAVPPDFLVPEVASRLAVLKTSNREFTDLGERCRKEAETHRIDVRTPLHGNTQRLQ